MTEKKKSKRLHEKRMAYLRSKLLQQRRELLHAIDRGTQKCVSRPNVMGDEFDAANESSDRETMYGISEIQSACLSEVEKALKKIDEGSYGQCERCGADIPLARLKVMPFASLCVSCKEKEERTAGSAGSDHSLWSKVQGWSNSSGRRDRTIESLSNGD
jgi:DnaK suppressor protein